MEVCGDAGLAWAKHAVERSREDGVKIGRAVFGLDDVGRNGNGVRDMPAYAALLSCDIDFDIEMRENAGPLSE